MYNDAAAEPNEQFMKEQLEEGACVDDVRRRSESPSQITALPSRVICSRRITAKPALELVANTAGLGPCRAIQEHEVRLGIPCRIVSRAIADIEEQVVAHR